MTHASAASQIPEAPTPAKPSPRLFPFLGYTKDGDKAARFSVSIFPNSRVNRVTALPHESPGGPPGSVKVVDFTLMGQRIQAMAGKHHSSSDEISITVPFGTGYEPCLFRKPRLQDGARGILLA